MCPVRWNKKWLKVARRLKSFESLLLGLLFIVSHPIRKWFDATTLSQLPTVRGGVVPWIKDSGMIHCWEFKWAILIICLSYRQNCVVCSKRGATVTCNQKIGLSKIGCPNNFHFSCAIAYGCVFLKDKVSDWTGPWTAKGQCAHLCLLGFRGSCS